MKPDLYDVIVDESNQYVIGLMVMGLLCPFVDHKKEYKNNYVRVKILIEGYNATKTETIFKSNSVNDLYYRKLSKKEKKQIRDAELFPPPFHGHPAMPDRNNEHWVKYINDRRAQPRRPGIRT